LTDICVNGLSLLTQPVNGFLAVVGAASPRPTKYFINARATTGRTVEMEMGSDTINFWRGGMEFENHLADLPPW
jgi:hypothetical protein